MNDNVMKNYIYDLAILLKEKAREAKLEKDECLNFWDVDYKLGYLMALHDTLSLMKQQADAFEISQDLIGLNDIEPDSDLL